MTILPSGGQSEALWNCSTVVSECVASSSAETAMRSFPAGPSIAGCPSPILPSCPLPGDLVSNSPRLGGLLVSLSLQCSSCRPFHNKPPSEPPSHPNPCSPPCQANWVHHDLIFRGDFVQEQYCHVVNRLHITEYLRLVDLGGASGLQDRVQMSPVGSSWVQMGPTR